MRHLRSWRDTLRRPLAKSSGRSFRRRRLSQFRTNSATWARGSVRWECWRWNPVASPCGRSPRQIPEDQCGWDHRENLREALGSNSGFASPCWARNDHHRTIPGRKRRGFSVRDAFKRNFAAPNRCLRPWKCRWPERSGAKTQLQSAVRETTCWPLD